jgi:hypothetical protein
MENKDMDRFEWVKARAACSLAAIFARLKMDLQKDVDDRQDLRPTGCPYDFKLVTNGNIATVLVEWKGINGAIEFQLTTGSNRRP